MIGLTAAIDYVVSSNIRWYFIIELNKYYKTDLTLVADLFIRPEINVTW